MKKYTLGIAAVLLLLCGVYLSTTAQAPPAQPTRIPDAMIEHPVRPDVAFYVMTPTGRKFVVLGDGISIDFEVDPPIVSVTGVGAPENAKYVVQDYQDYNDTLTDERKVAAGLGIILIDNGPGSTIDIAVDGNYVATQGGNNVFTGINDFGEMALTEINQLEVLTAPKYVYALAHTPVLSRVLKVYKDGIRLAAGIDYAHTATSVTITDAQGTVAGDKIQITYFREE